VPGIDIRAPEGAVTIVGPEDARPRVAPTARSVSSHAAAASGVTVRDHESAQLAARLHVTQRAAETALRMVGTHLAQSVEVRAGTMTAVLDGIRRASLTGSGFFVRERGPELNVGVALLADPLVLLVVGSEERSLHWSLLPGGPSVTARADGLRFIRALAASGQLAFQLADREALPPIEIVSGPWEYEDEWRLFEDLATLEEWSGVTLPMPDAVSAEDATAAAEAASWARSQQIDAELAGAITFRPLPAATLGKPDELRLHQDFGIEVLSTELPLGEGIARVPLRAVDRESDGEEIVHAWPARSNVVFWLTPPPTRRLPARRTQPLNAPQPDVAEAERLVRASVVRPARRRLAEVLEEHRHRPKRAAEYPTGTAGLLDEIRGE
jgi:hypothetical protein